MSLYGTTNINFGLTLTPLNFEEYPPTEEVSLFLNSCECYLRRRREAEQTEGAKITEIDGTTTFPTTVESTPTYLIRQRLSKMELAMINRGREMWQAINLFAATVSAYEFGSDPPPELNSAARLHVYFRHIYSCTFPVQVVQTFADFLIENIADKKSDLFGLLRRRRDIEYPCSISDSTTLPNPQITVSFPVEYQIAEAVCSWFGVPEKTTAEQWNQYDLRTGNFDRLVDLLTCIIPNVMVPSSRIDPGTLDFDELLRALRAVHALVVMDQSVETMFDVLLMQPLQHHFTHKLHLDTVMSVEWKLWSPTTLTISPDLLPRVQKTLLGLKDTDVMPSPLTSNCLVDLAHLFQYVDTKTGCFFWLDYMTYSTRMPSPERHRRQGPTHRPSWGIEWRNVLQLVSIEDLSTTPSASSLWFEPTGADKFVVDDAMRRAGQPNHHQWWSDIVTSVFDCEDEKDLSVETFLSDRILSNLDWFKGTGRTKANVPVHDESGEFFEMPVKDLALSAPETAESSEIAEAKVENGREEENAVVKTFEVYHVYCEPGDRVELVFGDNEVEHVIVLELKEKENLSTGTGERTDESVQGEKSKEEKVAEGRCVEAHYTDDESSREAESVFSESDAETMSTSEEEEDVAEFRWPYEIELTGSLLLDEIILPDLEVKVNNYTHLCDSCATFLDGDLCLRCDFVASFKAHITNVLDGDARTRAIEQVDGQDLQSYHVCCGYVTGKCPYCHKNIFDLVTCPYCGNGLSTEHCLLNCS
uniref:Uncharacterized protein n=1 Tax=Branchiostoma floridae TaxID=7739 RepID=C3ZJR5_BRAFL|eukprot:XP_002591189.1 hypothetical protein BRAFLDRAFT_105391 [Branchiostoma floridae]